MESTPSYYTILFNAVTDALEMLKVGEIELTEKILKEGQQAAEDAYIEGE